jgi:hypothetical protein
MTNVTDSLHRLGCSVQSIDVGTVQSKLSVLGLTLSLLAMSRYAFQAMRFLGERQWLLEFLGSLTRVLLTFSVAYVFVLVFLTWMDRPRGYNTITCRTSGGDKAPGDG